MNPLSSGIDVNGIVSALMDVEKISLGRMEKSKSLCDWQLNNYTHLNGLLKRFTESVDDINTILNNTALQANSSDDAVISAAVSGKSAAVGSYNVVVKQLAAANQIASAPFAAKDTALNFTDSLTIQTGTENFTLSIASNDTLETIRNNINISANNKSVNASILSTTARDGITAEFRLILTSKQTGASQAINLSGSGLEDLSLTNEISLAQDAVLTFDGFEVVRSVNTFADLVDGITISLNSVNNATLNILPDNNNKIANIKKGISSAIDNYNAIIDLIDKNQSTKSLRDNTYAVIKSQLTNTIKTWLDFGVKTAPSSKLLNDDGIEYVTTGKLVFDDKFFDLDRISFIPNLQEIVTNITKDDGIISSGEKLVKQQESTIEKRINHEQLRLDLVKERLIKQYAALDSFVQHYQQISGFLDRQIEAMNHIYSR
jgi:flagellar hook-associated protein 2